MARYAYELDVRAWDRSGRIHTERYYSSAFGAVDPLADHFRGLSSLGGSGGREILSGQTIAIVGLAIPCLCQAARARSKVDSH